MNSTVSTRQRYPTILVCAAATKQDIRRQTVDDCVYTYLCRVWQHRSVCWGFCPLELWGAQRWWEAWTDSCWRWCSSLREEKEKLGIRKQDPTGLQGYRFHQKHTEQLRMLALESKVSHWFLEVLGFYQGGFQVSTWQFCSYLAALLLGWVCEVNVFPMEQNRHMKLMFIA